MVMIKREFGFKFIEWIIYFILTGVAITFIVQGKVLDKYLKERSTFAQSEETITDHPTIISCVKPSLYWQDLVLGTDFGIRYMINGDPTSEMHLYPKIDNVTGSHSTNKVFVERMNIWIEVGIEEIDHELSKNCQHIITFKTDDITAKHSLVYDFYNAAGVKEVDLYFVSKENYLPTLIGRDPYHREGQALLISTTLGEGKMMTLQVSKHMYLNRTKDLCRSDSYMKTLLTRLGDGKWNNCNIKCHTFGRIGSIFQKVAPNLPECENEEDRKCTQDVVDEIKKDIISKPCTKVEYSSFNQNSQKTDTKGRMAFDFGFSYPGIVQVYEEVLLFDEIAMISSIGGTLGLCIGFAFSNIVRSMLSFGKRIMNWTKLKSEKVNESEDFQNGFENNFLQKDNISLNTNISRRPSIFEQRNNVEVLSIESFGERPESRMTHMTNVVSRRNSVMF